MKLTRRSFLKKVPKSLVAIKLALKMESPVEPLILRGEKTEPIAFDWLPAADHGHISNQTAYVPYLFDEI